MSKLDPGVLVKGESEVMAPLSPYSELDYPLSDGCISKASLSIRDRYEQRAENDIKPVNHAVRLKRSFSEFEACNSTISEISDAFECKKLVNLGQSAEIGAQVYHMTINDDFWAANSNSNFAWGKEHPRSMFTNLYGRLHLPLPQFTWVQVIYGEERVLDPKNVHFLSNDLIRGGSVFLELTYTRLDNAEVITTLRFQAYNSYSDTIHCASVVALAHILFVPAVVPTGYTQNNLHAEARLCFRLDTVPLLQILSHLASKINDHNFTVIRSKLFIRAAISAGAQDLRPKVYHEDVHSFYFLTGTLPTKKRTGFPKTRDTAFLGPAKRSSHYIQRKTIPVNSSSNLQPNQLHQRLKLEQYLPQPSKPSNRGKTSKKYVNFKAKYVQIEADDLNGLKENEEEKTFRQEFQSAPFDEPSRLKDRIQQVIHDIADSPTGYDRPFTELFELWKLKKNEVIRIILSLPSPPILWLLRRKIEYDCTDTRILLKVLTMMTQLLASEDDPTLVAPKLIDHEFMEHVHVMFQWISEFDQNCEVAKTGITLLCRLFMLSYELSPEVNPDYLFSTLSNANKSLVTLAGYCHESRWIEDAYDRISSWVDNCSDRVDLDKA